MGKWSDDLLRMVDGQRSVLLQLELARYTRKGYDVHVWQYLERCVMVRKSSVPLFVMGWAGMFCSAELVATKWEQIHFCSI